jgi:uncharacterized protein YbjT (DUF2867 family)
VGGVNQPSDDEILAANHGSTLAAIAATKEAGVRRFILLSVPGASVDSPHPFLRAKGLAEEVVRHSGLEHAVLRTSHAYGLGGLWFTSVVMGADHGFVVGDGTQRWAPVLADDVASLIAAVDDRHDRVEGVWSLTGPEELSADDVFAIAGEGGKTEHLDPVAAAERLSALLEIPVSARATESFAMSSVADAPDAAHAFGVALAAFEDGLRRVASKVAEGG